MSTATEAADAPTRLPLVDAMISVHGIGPVFADTVLSILDQRSIRMRCLVVVDGCPYLDDVQPVLDDLTRAGRHDLSVIYQKNAGVPAARNRAIVHFLAHEERADYVFFMDGDDIAPPNFIEAGVQALERAKAAAKGGQRPGWAYADQCHFGDQSYWVQYPPELWGRRFALKNHSQPSSVISMAMLEAQVAFDPDFTHGIEDWDFWCSAVSAGFHGVQVTSSAMRYRRLLGSRSSGNRANDPLTKFRLTRKHRLDQYDTIVADPETPPRRAVLRRHRAAPRPTQIQAPCADLSLASADIERLWSRLAMKGGAEHHIVFGPPHVPDVLEIDTGPDPGQPLRDDVFFMAEHLFHEDPRLAGLQITTRDNCHHLLLAPRRMMATRDPNRQKLAVFDLDDATRRLRRVGKSQIGALAPENRLVIQHMLRHLPRQQGTKGQIERRWVRARVANPWAFYRQSLGFLPYLPDPEAQPSRSRSAVVAEETLLNTPEGQAALATLFDQLAREKRQADLVILQARPGPRVNTAMAAASHAACGGVHLLFAIHPRNASRPQEQQDGEGTGGVHQKWLRYASGLLSWFDEIMNLGSSDASVALATLKGGKSLHCVYVPTTTIGTPNEMRHLCDHAEVYQEIRAPTPCWRDRAIGLGVSERLFETGKREAR